ncbi:MAG: AhpC/TSA family protein [Acidobacteria bacterium]|nr:AhpC/TSA family protein [Acidobacteriota bacterium]
MKTQVLLVGFGSPELARAWARDVQVPFPLLLDPERTVYEAYQLQHTRVGIWKPRVFLEYFKLLRKGYHLQPVQGDAHQLGGDFIIGTDRCIQFSHPSKDPSDRPTINQIFKTLRTMRP